MKLGARSSLAEVALAVGDALRRARIRAVLTGGACAHVYSGGAHQSLDADFVILGVCTTETLDRAMATVGFDRVRGRYVHPAVSFFVEFPKGPLGIGDDFRVRPVWTRRRSRRTLSLSATDSCRDRLAAFYQWKDRQALAAAVAIAIHNRVAYRKIREWSRDEEPLESYSRFLSELARFRGAKGGRTRGTRSIRKG